MTCRNDEGGGPGVEFARKNEWEKLMANVVSMKMLLEAGVHFGHQTRRWDPRMKSFIFTQRNGIHIIDLQQTVGRLNQAYDFVRELTALGRTILFVGTKKQGHESVQSEATRCGMPWVTRRWLGGMLTNFRTIQSRVKRLEELEARHDAGEFERLPKKEARKLRDETARLSRLFGGIRTMNELPAAVFVIDPNRERLAVAEARRLEVPIVAMVDTNCNPQEIDYVIPANDDAIRAIRLLTTKIADAAVEGIGIREVQLAEEQAQREAETQRELEESESVLEDAEPEVDGEDKEEPEASEVSDIAEKFETLESSTEGAKTATLPG
jgi:small subunit ribosomal protein S2